jgi:hypothetical protein
MRWPIHEPADLLQMPEGITGWLMPADAKRHRRGLRGLERRGLHPGRQGQTHRQTDLLGERVDVATGQVDDPNRARFDLASGRHSAFMDLSQPQEKLK